jgi:hypothetical protein
MNYVECWRLEVDLKYFSNKYSEHIIKKASTMEAFFVNGA